MKFSARISVRVMNPSFTMPSDNAASVCRSWMWKTSLAPHSHLKTTPTSPSVSGGEMTTMQSCRPARRKLRKAKLLNVSSWMMRFAVVTFCGTYR